MSSNSPVHNIITDTSKPKKSKHSKQSQNENNMPTVPISVYRELASELETTKRQLESLKQKNKQLNQQNQSLRLEVSQLVQSVQRLESTLQYWDQPSDVNAEHPSKQSWSQIKSSPNDSPSNDEPMEGIPTEMESPYNNKQLSSSQEINGWLLLVIMILIIISFAGIGFAVARPLLEGEFNQNLNRN